MSSQSGLYVTGFLLGGFLSFIFVGYIILSFSEGRKWRRVTASQRFAGVFSVLLGIVMLGAWGYFMLSGWSSFWSQAAQYSVHVLLELVCAIMLMIAGVGLLRGWSRAPALYLISNGLLVFTLVLALAAHGMSGHPFLMNGISMFLVLASGYFMALVYGWEHFVLRIDRDREPKKEREEKRSA